jgi:hypothetical protein
MSQGEPMRTADEIVQQFDALAGVGEGHFKDDMETEELKVLIEEIKRLNFILDAYVERQR